MCDWNGYPPHLCGGGSLGRRPAAPSRRGRHDPLGTKRGWPQFATHGGSAGSVALFRPGDCGQPDAGEGDRPCQVSGPARSMPAFWRSSMPAAFCLRSGFPMSGPSGFAVWSRGATRPVRHRTRVKNEMHLAGAPRAKVPLAPGSSGRCFLTTSGAAIVTHPRDRSPGRRSG